MSLPDPSLNDEVPSSSSVQRLLIAGATLIVVALTVIAAVLLAVRNPAEATVTPAITPTTVGAGALTLTPTPLPLPPTFTPTTTPIALSATPTATSIPTGTPTQTPLPPPPTETPVPQPPAPTITPIIVIVTATPAGPPPVIETPMACPPPPNWAAYSVESGDTLNTLANRTGVSVFELQHANCLVNLTLQPGQVVYLPFNPPTSTPTSTTTPVTPSPTPSRISIPTRPPEIFSATLSQQEQIITVVGRNFKVEDIDFKAALIGGGPPNDNIVEIRNFKVRSSTGLVFAVPPDLPSGIYDVYVINPDGQFDFVEDVITIP